MDMVKMTEWYSKLYHLHWIQTYLYLYIKINIDFQFPSNPKIAILGFQKDPEFLKDSVCEFSNHQLQESTPLQKCSL